MHVLSLVLTNFRNYDKGVACFDKNTNFIIGDNGHGKTNILEALSILTTGSSFRTHKLREMIKFGCSFFQIDLTFEKFGIEQTLSFYFDGSIKKITLNNNPIKSSLGIFGILTGVFMCPEHYKIIQEGPSYRRRFLDILISQIDPVYVHHLQRYTKSIAYRNDLLKKKCLDTIETWEELISISGSYISVSRINTINELSHLCNSTCKQLTEDVEHMSLQYISQVSDKSTNNEEFKSIFMKKLSDNRRRDLLFGETLIGPHRDEIKITLNNKEARFFSSEGQKKTATIALKIATWEMLKNRTDTLPLLCIDDIESGLDKKRQTSLQRILESKGQLFITNPVLKHLHNCNVIFINNGKICST